MDLLRRALLPGLRITYDLAFDRVVHHGRLVEFGGGQPQARGEPHAGQAGKVGGSAGVPVMKPERFSG